MWRRRLLWLLAGLVLVSAAEFVSIARPPGLTPESFKRLPGMSRAEVECLLGPPGDYRSGPTYYDMGGPPERFRDWGHDLWWYDYGTLDVQFDGSGKVQWRFIWPASKVKQRPLDNLRWRIERQWRRWFP